MSQLPKTARSANPAADQRYSRATLLSVSLIATGVLCSGVHSATAPGTVGPLLYTGFTFILAGILTWTAAATVHDRASESSNGR